MEITCTRTTSVAVTYAGTLRRVVIVMDDMTGRMVIVKDSHVCVSAWADCQSFKAIYKITSLASDGNYLYTDDIRCCHRLTPVDTDDTCCRPSADDIECIQVRGMILHDTWMTNTLLRKNLLQWKQSDLVNCGVIEENFTTMEAK